jgi:dTDP-4-amino-4,6-dideoxygalactose transaminase
LTTYGSPGKVLVPVNVCEGVVGTLIYSGWEPVFHDVDPLTGNPDLPHLEQADLTGVSLWIAVHNYGTPLNLPRMLSWSRQNDLTVIEDACLAMGAQIDSQPVGHFGDAAIFSFGHAKIVEVGSGGAALVKDPAWRASAKARLSELPGMRPEHHRADEAFQNVLRAMRQNPWVQKPEIYRPFFREYLPQMLFQADQGLRATITAKMAEIETIVNRRNQRAAQYRHHLAHPLIQHRPETPEEVCWRYTFLVLPELRDGLLKTLRGHDVPASAWYPPINHLFQAPSSLDDFPGASHFGNRVINLWVDQTVSEDTITHTSKIILDYLEEHK